jgi:predicted CoA-substrate-specific enzyme activase
VSERYFAGIDVGSLSTDVVIIDHHGNTLVEIVTETGVDGSLAADQAFDQAVNSIGLMRDQIQAITATGYGRRTVEFASQHSTEISCHGLGAHLLFPGTGTVVDIGGQDSKVISVDSKGRMLDFAMNDKCAAGTGRFLEVMAQRLDMDLEELGDPGNITGAAVQISSTCTVFAESEVVSLLAKRVPRHQIVNGLQRSIVSRIQSMIATVGLQAEVTLSGGVALNRGLVKLLEERIGHKVNIPANPQTVGALGAAHLARVQNP